MSEFLFLLHALQGASLNKENNFFSFLFLYEGLLQISHYSPFEVVYVFNPLILLDLLPISSNVFVSDATTNKVELIKTQRKKVKEKIVKNNSKVAL